ncbi:hypothetical protein SAMN04490204_0331 [Pseudomonas thivervalensis]|nr:hypothetical protein SAMN04490204_0331 [Pseudomonas thivervalensis]
MVKRYEIPDAAWELVADLCEQPGAVVGPEPMIV